MKKKQINNNVKLGIFVLAGLAFLIVLLYMIGNNSNLFQATFTLRAKFDNIQGLVAGNNVRFAGIESGTVKNVTILNDSVIEVKMVIDKKFYHIIRKNAVASIGTEGLVGNKVLNIVPSRTPAPFAEDGDVLDSRGAIDTEAILRTLTTTNNNIAVITDELRSTVQRINNSVALWGLLDDVSIPRNIKASLENIRLVSNRTAFTMSVMDSIVSDIRLGKGSVGALLTDTTFAANLNDAIVQIKIAGNEADSLGREIRTLVTGMQSDINNGQGTVNALFKDSALVRKLHISLDNIQTGTNGFNQNMEALKHNFLFRKYFRKLEKQRRKIVDSAVASE